MWALECADLQDSAGESLASLTVQPSVPHISPPLSRKLSVDGKLKWSNENFKQKIYDFFIDKNITQLSQLIATPAQLLT
jgi:hypothetical protein